ncbi:hypothetical protein [Oryzisolibacter sp. LB2S]|uniref:hypothetical protein n=1 Tax=Alicycliphilus soli TaxID=3228789 RepID=UPI0034591AEE
MMFDDLGASPAQVAKLLGITERTMRRYLQADDAPRPVLLALFWETRWGRSAADCDAHNYAQVQHGLAQALQSQNARLVRQVRELERLLDSNDRAANRPFFRAA